MKKNITLALGLLFLVASACAQNGLENIIVEKYYVSNASDAAFNAVDGALPVGSVTYRIYADMLPGYKFQSAYGVPGHELRLATTTSFFNNEDRGATTPAYTKVQASHNTVMLDSWLSVGAACAGNFGVLKTEDNGVATVVNTDGILQNNDPSAGIPLTVQDGLLLTTDTPQVVSTVGITSDITIFNATSGVGNLFSTLNGAWASLNGSTGPTSTNRILIAQMTTNGCFSFELNIQIGTPGGGVQNYVAKNPVGNEIQLASLSYNVASVSIVPNPAGPVCVGTNVTFTATPVNGGTTPVYQWKKNGVNVGTNSATYATSSLANNDQVTCVMTSNAACISGSPATSNTIIAVINPVSPSITSFSPTLGTYGAVVTIIGSGFAGTSDVQINNLSVSFTIVSSNQITATVPTNATSGTIKVINACATATSSSTFKIQGLEDIIVEKYYVSNAADTTFNSSFGNLPVGSVTYRIYADMLPGYKFQSAYGIPGHELRLQTSTSFFNNEDRGAVEPAYTKTQASHNTVMLDSWLSAGAACAGNFGIMKIEDNAVANVVNTDSLLHNNDPTAGIPLTSRDGIILTTDTPQTISTIGITGTINSILNSTSDAGSLLSTFDGAWASLNGSTGPTSSNRVLIAQITTNGCFTFELNIQIRTPDNGVQNYVAKNPVGNEIQLASLIYNAALVSIAASPSGSVCPGTNVTFTATPVNGGTTPSYQWKKNGVNVGTNSATFSTSSLLNNDLVTCVMTSNSACVIENPATSNTLTIAVTPVPAISSFAPATGSLGTVVTINGSGFTGTYDVKFNGVSTVFSVINSNQLTATVPAGAANGTVTVTNTCGTGTSLSSFIVQGLQNIIVEKYYVSDRNDATPDAIDGVLPVGSVTYRIYVDMLPGYKFQSAYGIPGHELRLETTTSFFNNEDRGATFPTYTKTQASHNTVMLDSWLSAGAACAGNFGILKTEDNGVANVVNTDGLLQNNDTSAGIPITSRDGFILTADTPQAVSTIGITSDMAIFDATSGIGSLFSTLNGAWASLNGATGPTSTNRILIAQITTDGCFSFQLNIQIGTPGNGIQNYVAMNPVGNEIQLPGLTYLNCPPVSNLNMNLFLQGYYTNPGSSTPMDNIGAGGCLYIGGSIDGFAADFDDVDSIFISLVDSMAYANTGDIAVATYVTKSGILKTNGLLDVLFPDGARGHSFYLKVNQRNHVETWSALPVLMSSATAYNFTDSYTKAYEFDGNPFHGMFEMEPNKWAIYAGDVYRDGTGFVDINDIPELTTQIEGVFPYGYQSGDLNGDGFIDIVDIPVLTTNIEFSGGVYAQHP